MIFNGFLQQIYLAQHVFIAIVNRYWVDSDKSFKYAHSGDTDACDAGLTDQSITTCLFDRSSARVQQGMTE